MELRHRHHDDDHNHHRHNSSPATPGRQHHQSDDDLSNSLRLTIPTLKDGTSPMKRYGLRSPVADSPRQLPSSSASVSLKRVTRQRNFLVILCLILLLALAMLIYKGGWWECNHPTSKLLRNHGSLCAISMGKYRNFVNLLRRDINHNRFGLTLTYDWLITGKYRGPVYTSSQSGTIGDPKCLLESTWFKVAQHQVKLPNSEHIIDDWLIIDYHDRINVVVEDERKTGSWQERKFLVFEQTKYALDGRQSLSIVGGIIEPGEEPEHAARREVNEEMGLSCKVFYPLGRFRTDVNRGMGWVNSFLATDCYKDQLQLQEMEDEVGAPDTERQDRKSMTIPQLRAAVANGEFLEIQWSSTVALALLHPDLAIDPIPKVATK